MSISIAPRAQGKGVDLCGMNRYYYIVRSDLGCFMRSTNINTGENLEVFGLHPLCRDGDHYLAHKNGQFYIIKGSYYRRVTNLNTDADAVLYLIHQRCQGGDHYMSTSDYFYVIFESRGVYHRTKDLTKDEDGRDFILHPKCRFGLYYFGLDDVYYLLKTNDLYGVHYVKCSNYDTDRHLMECSFHPSVINFLPGGLGITIGPAYGEWILVDRMINYLDVPSNLQRVTSRKIGYEKQKMSCIEHNWNVSSDVAQESGGLTALLLKRHFSLSVEYGGCNVDTDKETWSEVTNIDLDISIDAKPNQEIGIWIYQLGLGKEPVLYCRDMSILDSLNFPITVLLPLATN